MVNVWQTINPVAGPGMTTIYTVPASMVFVLETVSFELFENQLNTSRLIYLRTSNWPTIPTTLSFQPQTAPQLAGGTTYLSTGTFHVTVRYPPLAVIQGAFNTFGPGNLSDNAQVSLFGHLEPQ